MRGDGLYDPIYDDSKLSFLILSDLLFRIVVPWEREWRGFNLRKRVVPRMEVSIEEWECRFHTFYR